LIVPPDARAGTLALHGRRRCRWMFGRGIAVDTANAERYQHGDESVRFNSAAPTPP